MQESGGGKAIKVTPEELVFDQLTPNNEQTQELVFKNNLSAPVDIVSHLILYLIVIDVENIKLRESIN